VFALAVTLAAARGGLGPGLVATALSILCIEFLFAHAIVSLVPGQSNVWFFGGFSVFITVIIHNFRRQNEKLARAKELLEAANKEIEQRSKSLIQSNEELERYAYALSHDLKNPLRTIGLFAERLAGTAAGKLDDDGLKTVRFIINGAHQAQDMVQSLLAYSVAAHEAASIEAATSLGTVVADALEEIQLLVQESGASITVEPLPTVPADGERLRQVFLNLLTNAIKYRCAERSPEIHVAARNMPGEWLISVRDNGIGIDPRYTEQVFGLFKRLHSASEYEGSGVGLALCRAIVQRHGGRIWVESELGCGSTFYFTLPIQQAKKS